MADIELVIKIDESKFQDPSSIDLFYMVGAIKNGTPLPKGHGRIIDVGKYEKAYFNVEIQYDDGNHIHSVYTNTIPTIIEADKG